MLPSHGNKGSLRSQLRLDQENQLEVRETP